MKKITFILPFKAGGVSVHIKNLVDLIKLDYSIFIIQTNLIEGNYPIHNNPFFDFENVKFNFSGLENRYKVLHKLAKLIPEDTDLLISNDWIELEAYSISRLKYKHIFILHGDYDYYYNLAVKYSTIIDKFICVSDFIEKTLKSKLTLRNKDIIHLRNIIKEPKPKQLFIKTTYLNILFVGRLTEEKGFFDLEKIDSGLKSQGLVVKWTIIGDKLEKNKDYRWLEESNVNWLGYKNNEEVLFEYHKHDVLILPSRLEGLGMVVIEAMKAGCVPITSNLQAGIPEFVLDGITGFKIEIDDIENYIKKIEHLNNFEIRKKMALNAQSLAMEMFNPLKAAEGYKNIFLVLNKTFNNRTEYPDLKFSTLDRSYLPNFIVVFIRKFIKMILNGK